MSEAKYLEEKEYIRKLGDFALREYIYSRDRTACLKRSLPRETMMRQALELAHAGPASQLATYHTTPHANPAVRRSLRNKRPDSAQACTVKLSKTGAGILEDLPSKKNFSSSEKAVQKAMSIKMSSRETKGGKGLTDQSSPQTTTTPRAHRTSPGRGSCGFDLSDMTVEPGNLKLSIGSRTTFIRPNLVSQAETLPLNPSFRDTDPSGHRLHKLSATTVSTQSVSATATFREDAAEPHQSPPNAAVPILDSYNSKKDSGKLLEKAVAARNPDSIPTKETLQRQASEPHQSPQHLAAPSMSLRVSKKRSPKIPPPIRVPTDLLESIPIEAILQAEAAERRAVDYLKEGNRWDNFLSGKAPDGLRSPGRRFLNTGSDIIHLEACLKEETLKKEDHLELERIKNCQRFVSEKAPHLLAQLRPRNSSLPRRPPLSLMCPMDRTEHLQLVEPFHEGIIIEAFLKEEAVEREGIDAASSKKPTTAVSPEDLCHLPETANPIINNHPIKSNQNGQASFVLLNTEEMTDLADVTQQTHNMYKSSVFQDLASLGPIYPNHGVLPGMGTSPISPKSRPAFLRLLPPSDTDSTISATELSCKTKPLESKGSLEPFWSFKKANEGLSAASFSTKPCLPSNFLPPSVDVPTSVDVSSDHECGELTGICVPALYSPLSMDLGIDLMALSTPVSHTSPSVNLDSLVEIVATVNRGNGNVNQTNQDNEVN